MWGWNWFFGAEQDSAAEQVGPEIPKDFDYYSWWNPADWGGNYDSDLDDYNRRKKEETIKKNTYQIVFFSLIVILGIYVIKK
tara:strand:+ start:184 stop:429 length:246 start_codon:yes stop_codon:yes gene_type:complete